MALRLILGFTIVMLLSKWGYCYTTTVMSGTVICTGCDNTKCFPNASEYSRRRSKRMIDAGPTRERFTGAPLCKTMSPDAYYLKSKVMVWNEMVNCTMKTITCRCVKWYYGNGAGWCFPSDMDLSGRRRRQRRASNTRLRGGSANSPGQSGARNAAASYGSRAAGRNNLGSNKANNKPVRPPAATNTKAALKRPTTTAKTIKGYKAPAASNRKSHGGSKTNRKRGRNKSSWNRRTKDDSDPEADMNTKYIHQYHVCSLTEDVLSERYFRWRDVCYLYSECSYPQVKMAAEPYRSYWFVIQSEMLMRGDERIYPGRYGPDSELHTSETQAKTYQEFCHDISKQYRPDDAYFYSYERIEPMDMIGANGEQPLEANVICTGCAPTVCTDDDVFKCTHFAESPDKVAPKFIETWHPVKCYMRIIRCRCKRPSLTTGLCLDPNPNKPVVNQQSGKRQQQQRQKQRHRRSTSYMEAFLTNFGKAAGQDSEYIDQTVCVSLEVNKHAYTWEQECNRAMCEYYQPRLTTMGDRQWVLFYADGSIFPGFTTADDGYGYRKLETQAMNRDDLCDSVGTPGYYRFDSVLRLNEKTRPNARRRGARA